MVRGLKDGRVVTRVGECNRCGLCCDTGRLPLRIAGYIAFGYDFKIKPEGCEHFEYRDGKGFCKIYDERPQMCRDFPAFPIDILFIPECGYRFVDEKGEIVLW